MDPLTHHVNILEVNSETLLIHHDGRGLAECASKVDAARLGDAARQVALARLVTGGRQADPKRDLLRGCEPGRVIDSGTIGQRHDRADPRHRHQPTTDRILLGTLTDMRSRPASSRRSAEHSANPPVQTVNRKPFADRD